MRFGPLQFWSLLGPLLLVAVPYAFSLLVMWGNPGSNLVERGAPALLVASVLACGLALLAVPAALFRMWRCAEYRTGTNLLLVACGGIPVVACFLLLTVVFYGHG